MFVPAAVQLDPKRSRLGERDTTTVGEPLPGDGSVAALGATAEAD
jgi:hypothetical protein